MDMGGQLAKLRLDFANNKNLTSKVFGKFMKTMKLCKNLQGVEFELGKFLGLKVSLIKWFIGSTNADDSYC